MFSIHFLIHRSGVITLLLTSIGAAADNPLWESGRVISVEQVAIPAREPDPSCLAVPKGAAPRLKFLLPEINLNMNVEAEVAWVDVKGLAGFRFKNAMS